jgi:hypothetical protein
MGGMIIQEYDNVFFRIPQDLRKIVSDNPGIMRCVIGFRKFLAVLFNSDDDRVCVRIGLGLDTYRRQRVYITRRETD